MHVFIKGGLDQMPYWSYYIYARIFVKRLGTTGMYSMHWNMF